MHSSAAQESRFAAAWTNTVPTMPTSLQAPFEVIPQLPIFRYKCGKKIFSQNFPENPQLFVRFWVRSVSTEWFSKVFSTSTPKVQRNVEKTACLEAKISIDTAEKKPSTAWLLPPPPSLGRINTSAIAQQDPRQKDHSSLILKIESTPLYWVGTNISALKSALEKFA